MTEFLCIRLYGPMAAWGDVAVGERRPATAQPSRSGVLGLVAACAGLRRSDGDELAKLDAELGFASRLEWPGELLVDYHTAEATSGPALRKFEKNGGRVQTRRDELLAKDGGNAIQTWRSYFQDAVASACLWNTQANPVWGLERIARVLAEPIFVPYLGRKSCPVSVPLDPQRVQASNPVDALKMARFRIDSFVAGAIPKGDRLETFAWEGNWPGLEPGKTVTRRDRLHSRSRWQFVERTEHVLQVQGGSDVPEQA